MPRIDDRTWSPVLAIDDFTGVAANRDWTGSIPADPNWRAVLRADTPGTIACTQGELHLSWPTSASLVHLFTFLPLPEVAPGSTLQLRIVLTSRTVADLLRVVIAVVLQHRRGDDFFNSLSLRDLRIVRTADGTQAIAEGVLDELPANLEQFKLLFRLNPAAGEIAVRSVEVFARAISADHLPADEAAGDAADDDAATPEAPVRTPASAMPAAPIAVLPGLPRLIQATPVAPRDAGDAVVRDQLAALRGDVFRLATTVAALLPGGEAEERVERLTQEVAALVRQQAELRQRMAEHVEALLAENDQLRREVDRLSVTAASGGR